MRPETTGSLTMKRLILLAGVCTLAACAGEPRTWTPVVTDTAIVVQWDDRLPRQTVEDIATRHCASHGLIARRKSAHWVGELAPLSLVPGEIYEARYECEAAPAGLKPAV